MKSLDEDLRRLIWQVLDGDADDDQRQELLSRFRRDPEARERYIDACVIHHELAELIDDGAMTGLIDLVGLSDVSNGQRDDFAAPQSDRSTEVTDERHGRRSVWPQSMWPQPMWPQLAIVMTAISATVLVSLLWSLDDDRFQNELTVDMPTPWATITGSWNAQPISLAGQADWSVDGQPQAFSRIGLAAGMVEISMAGGQTVLLEGPGELELSGPDQAFLHRGQAVVRTTGHRSFRLKTPTLEIHQAPASENGECEFGASSIGNNVTEVQVYQGDLIAASRQTGGPSSYPQRITAGQAKRFDDSASRSQQDISFAPARFVRRCDLPPGIPRPPGTVSIQNGFSNSRHALMSIGSVQDFETPIVIDGDLSEWFVHRTGSVEPIDVVHRRDEKEIGGFIVQAAFDADAFYLAIQVHDRHPMRSQIDPEADGHHGWRGGGFQLRLSTDRKSGWPIDANASSYYHNRDLVASPNDLTAAANPKLSHLTMWYHAASQTACLHRAEGMNILDGQVNPQGYQGAFRMWDQGDGYTAEYALPWSLLQCAEDPPRSGDELPLLWDVHWADPTGRQWQDHRVEVRNANEPRQIFSWERAAVWGRAVYQ